MIFVFNNIKFGHPKLWHFQQEYFHHFFDSIKKLDKDKDLYILGPLFNNTVNNSFRILNNMKSILILLNKEFKNVNISLDCNENIFPLFADDLKLGILDDKIENKVSKSLFQFSKSDDPNVGYYIFKEDKTKFIENTLSPKFIEYKISSIDDLENINITKDFIDIEIDSDLLEKAEYKNKIDIYLSKNTFNNVFYTEKKKKEDKVLMDSSNLNIRSILVDNVDDGLKEELKEIFTIYDEKNAEPNTDNAL
jgi:hypothetical protein